VSLNFDDDALRAIVRETIARLQSQDGAAAQPQHAPLIELRSHPSHYRYTLPPSGGPCYIEPEVSCTHCGFCQSHGH
jgi:hypothetical protein